MRLLAAIMAGLLWASCALGYTGSGGVWATKAGDFVSRNFPGDSTGVAAAISYCGSNGTVQLGPGLENVGIGSIPAGVRVYRVQGGTVTPRLGPLSGPTSGGAIRIVDGVTFPLTVAGVQAAMNECGANGGGTTLVPASARIQITTMGLKIPNRVTLKGIGSSLDSSGTFVCSSTCNIGAVIENARVDGTQAYAGVENINIVGSQAGGATDSVGIRFRSVFIGSYIRDVRITGIKGDAIVLDDPGNHGIGGLDLQNIVIADVSGDGIRGGALDGSVGILNNLRFRVIDIERWGTGKAALRLSGMSGTSASFGATIDGLYMEEASDSTADGLVLHNYSNVVADGISTNGAGVMNYPVKIEGAATNDIFGCHGVVIRNVQANVDTMLFDQVNNYAIVRPASNMQYFYEYQTPSVTSSATSLGGPLRLPTSTFANLTSLGNGTMIYCSDCTKATPCAGSGAGAFAYRINGAWDCNP